MPRPRLRPALRSLARRILGVGSEPAQPPLPPTERREREGALAGLPPLQPGRGETPGPNHKRDISREWAGAQLVSGVPPFFLDVRPPMDFSRARIARARSMPGWQVRERLADLPAREERIVVYDQTGAEQAGEVAAWLREQGFGLARRLAGGFAGWQANGEPVEAGPGG